MINDYEFQLLIDCIVRDYKGDGAELSAALGVLVLGRLMGWRVVYLLHTEPTMRKYQSVLGVVFKDILPERTVLSRKSVGLSIVDKFDIFWKVLQGKDKTVSRVDRNLLV